MAHKVVRLTGVTDEVASKLYPTDAPEDMSATYLTKRKVIGYIYVTAYSVQK